MAEHVHATSKNSTIHFFSLLFSLSLHLSLADITVFFFFSCDKAFGDFSSVSLFRRRCTISCTALTCTEKTKGKKKEVKKDMDSQKPSLKTHTHTVAKKKKKTASKKRGKKRRIRNFAIRHTHNSPHYCHNSRQRQRTQANTTGKKREAEKEKKCD